MLSNFFSARPRQRNLSAFGPQSVTDAPPQQRTPASNEPLPSAAPAPSLPTRSLNAGNLLLLFSSILMALASLAALVFLAMQH
jgi:hypothetical protein